MVGQPVIWLKLSLMHNNRNSFFRIHPSFWRPCSQEPSWALFALLTHRDSHFSSHTTASADLSPCCLLPMRSVLHSYRAQATHARASFRATIPAVLPGKLLDGRPPALLKSDGKSGKAHKQKKRRLTDQGVRVESGNIAPAPRALCQASLKSEDSKARNLLRQAVALVNTQTSFADCTYVLKTLVDEGTSRTDEAAVRYIAETLSQRISAEGSDLNLDPRNLSLAASALAKSEVWVPSFGTLIQQLFVEKKLKSFNPTDITQLCRFMAVFRRSIADEAMASVWTTAQLQLQDHEQCGYRLETTGLVSLLRSLALTQGTSHKSEMATLAKWLRARLVDELASCSPRQLASALLDLGALDLLDNRSVMHLQREITRAASDKQMRPRDLASIFAGYSKLPAPLQERQMLMAPLLPAMLVLMPNCSLQDMCRVLHGLASAHIANKVLLEAWSSTFSLKAGRAWTRVTRVFFWRIRSKIEVIYDAVRYDNDMHTLTLMIQYDCRRATAQYMVLGPFQLVGRAIKFTTHHACM